MPRPENLVIANQICRGAIEAPPALVLWSDLRGDALAKKPDNAVFIGCLFEPDSLAELRGAGITIMGSAETNPEVASILELPGLGDPFCHYSTLQEILEGMADPVQAAAPLAQLCLNQPWPLAENAWLNLKAFCAESFQGGLSGFAWRALLLRLSQLDSLRAPLRDEVQEKLSFARSALFWERIWKVPWCEEAPSWILEATGTLLWHDEEILAFPLEQWLRHPLTVPLPAMPALERCLVQRHLCHLLDDSADAQPEWRRSLAGFCRSWLESDDLERVDWALRWVERFAPSGLLDCLLDMPARVPMVWRQQAAWVAYGCHPEFDARHRILASGLLGQSQRESLALSSDPETDWVGYVDSEQARWLVDPAEIAAGLTGDGEQPGWALGWMSHFPFPELRPLLDNLSPVGEQSASLEIVLDLYRRRSSEPKALKPW